MALFEHIEALRGASIMEQHEFPLFELTGLYQKFVVEREQMQGECIMVNLNEARDYSDEALLNLIVASGYVRDDADISFRIDAARQYFYAYFHLEYLEKTSA